MQIAPRIVPMPTSASGTGPGTPNGFVNEVKTTSGPSSVATPMDATTSEMTVSTASGRQRRDGRRPSGKSRNTRVAEGT